MRNERTGRVGKLLGRATRGASIETACTLLVLVVAFAVPNAGVAQLGSDDVELTAADYLVRSLHEHRSGSQSRVLRRTTPFFSIDKHLSAVQVAFVIDGTESMGQELDALKGNIEKIADAIKEHARQPMLAVESAIVVYRDKRAPSGPVKMLTPAFTADLSTLSRDLSEVRVETGAPYFDEAVDQGIQEALTKLNWKAGDDIARWIVVCGDAPPYPEGSEPRLHSLQQLIDAAKEKSINVYGFCVATSSEFSTANSTTSAWEQVRSEWSVFLTRLAEATGGKVRNLWDQELLLADLHKKPITVALQKIDARAIEAARRELGRTPVFAVLPTKAVGQSTLASGETDASLAVAIQKTLENSGYIVHGPAAVEGYPELRTIAVNDSTSPNVIDLRRLATQLPADFIISVATEAQSSGGQTESRKVTISVFSQATSSIVADRSVELSPKDALEGLQAAVQDAIMAAQREASSSSPTSTEQAAQPVDSAGAARVAAPLNLSGDLRTERAILAAIYSLEKSVSSTASPESQSEGSPHEAAVGHLEKALAQLQSAAVYDPDNPVVELLLSQVHYNLAQLDDGDDASQLSYTHLERAFQLRTKPGFAEGLWATEIEAQHKLLVQKDIAGAVEIFERITKQPGREFSMQALRAHWMLAGIFLGDWGARVFAPSIVDLDKAQEHVLAILVRWPDLPEGKFYSICIDSTGEQGEVQLPLVAAANPHAPSSQAATAE